ncbi:hypothetical protein [Streptomyces nigrescens]
MTTWHRPAGRAFPPHPLRKGHRPHYNAWLDLFTAHTAVGAGQGA